MCVSIKKSQTISEREKQLTHLIIIFRQFLRRQFDSEYTRILYLRYHGRWFYLEKRSWNSRVTKETIPKDRKVDVYMRAETRGKDVKEEEEEKKDRERRERGRKGRKGISRKKKRSERGRGERPKREVSRNLTRPLRYDNISRASGETSSKESRRHPATKAPRRRPPLSEILRARVRERDDQPTVEEKKEEEGPGKRCRDVSLSRSLSHVKREKY